MWGVRLRLLLNPRGGPLDLRTELAVILWAATVGLAVAVLVALPRAPAPAIAVGLGLCIGGSISNLLDRLVRGGVVDFIAIGRWPSFNPADAALTLGLALVALTIV